MSKRRTREKKSAKPQQPAKPDEISVGRRFAQPYAKARLLFDHAHSYREWNIVGQYDVPGFFYLESRFPLNMESSQRSTRPSNSVFMSANFKGSRFDRALLIQPGERSLGFPPERSA
jgi:hypothetical protein